MRRERVSSPGRKTWYGCLDAAAPPPPLGIKGRVSRSTLADANEKRDWRIYAAFAQKVIAEGRRLYAGDPLDLELDQTVYALDSTTIDLCLSLFPWARLGRERSSIKVHTLLDLHGNIPANLWITTRFSTPSDSIHRCSQNPARPAS